MVFLGRNINVSHGLVSSAKYAESIGANFYQIFLTNPQQYRCKRPSEATLLALRDELTKRSMKLVIHASFMLNFCNPPDSGVHKRALDLLIADMKDSVVCGAIGVIVHMGKKLKMNEQTAIANYVLGIKHVLSKTPPSSILIFETGAGQGTEVCTSIQDLGKLYRMFTKKERKRIRFCIDTCHVYASGYDLGNTYFVDLFEQLIDTYLGWDKVACIHLNDSKCCLGSCKDRHQDIGYGCINLSGLRKFTKLCYDKNIPVVLETPIENTKKDTEIELIKSWI